MLLFNDKQKTMTKKQKIIQLLQKENQELAKFFLEKLDSMSKGNMQDLYFLLTSKDKSKISKFSERKNNELQKKLLQLEHIGTQAENLSREFKESQEIENDNSIAENLLKNL